MAEVANDYVVVLVGGGDRVIRELVYRSASKLRAATEAASRNFDVIRDLVGGEWLVLISQLDQPMLDDDEPLFGADGNFLDFAVGRLSCCDVGGEDMFVFQTSKEGWDR